MQNEIEVLIFDMDGTLIDSSAVISGSINYVRSKLGLDPMDRDVMLKAVNDMHTHSPSFFYEVDEFEKSHIEWFQEYYTKNYDKEVRLYDGIRELLEELKPRYKLSLATNAYRVSALEILEHLKIDDYFDIIVCADDVKNSKPHPDMIYKILDFFKVDSKRALMIGDSLKDKESASRAGVDTILVDWGFSDLDDALREVEELKKLLLG
jgi:phosphoglycolate phosphatase